MNKIKLQIYTYNELAKLNLHKQAMLSWKSNLILYILYINIWTLKELLKRLEGKKVCIKEKQVAKVDEHLGQVPTPHRWADCWLLLWAYQLVIKHLTIYNYLTILGYLMVNSIYKLDLTFINSWTIKYCI